MDWLYSKAGAVGRWALTYPLAVVTIVGVAIILYIAYCVLEEWNTKVESPLFAADGTKFMNRAIPTGKAFRFIGLIVIVVAAVGYGTYRYYLISNATLLAEYPLGYVILDAHSEKSFFPYSAHGQLAEWDINWNTFRYSKYVNADGKEIVRVRLPDIRINPNFTLSAIRCETVDAIGPLCGSKYIIRSGNIGFSGRILKTNSSGTVILLGFGYTN